jgi:hypothetical protein
VGVYFYSPILNSTRIWLLGEWLSAPLSIIDILLLLFESFICPDHKVTGEDRKIPLLRDIFEAFPDMPINVDIKVNDDALIQQVLLALLSNQSSLFCVPCDHGKERTSKED